MHLKKQGCDKGVAENMLKSSLELERGESSKKSSESFFCLALHNTHRQHGDEDANAPYLPPLGMGDVNHCETKVCNSSATGNRQVPNMA